MPPFRMTPNSYPPMLHSDDDDMPLDLDPLPPQGDVEINDARRKKVNLYVRLLARWPYVITFISLLFGLTGLTFYFKGFPDFSDPSAGFEARGTAISGTVRALRLISKGNLISATPNETIAGEILGLDPNSEIMKVIFNQRKRDVTKYRKTRDVSQAGNCASQVIDGSKMKLVIQSKNKESLYSAKMLRAICEIEDRFVTEEIEKYTECRMHSLPFYIAALNNKCCHEIRESDLNKTLDLLDRCAPAFHNGSLMERCSDDQHCPHIEKECYKYDAVFKILQYMTDVGFYTKNASAMKKNYLKYSMIIFSSFLQDPLDYFHRELENKDLSNEHVKVIAVYNSEYTKFDLFNDYLLKDLLFFGVAMGLILVILMIYLLSLSLMVATIVNVALSFATAYFVYTVVLGIKFFPFMNLLGGLILIAVGADDVFIFYDTWRQVTMTDPDLPMELIVQRTFKHAALSIFVTSLTTSAAFFANSVSSIAAIRCFGLFAGIAVLANFIFMVTWTPSIVVLTEMITRVVMKGNDQLGNYWKSTSEKIKRKWERGYSLMHKFVVGKLWFIWILLYLALGIGGLVIVFVEPKLRLPQSKDFQLFPSHHPMEYFDQKLRGDFQFLIDETASKAQELTITFAWGTKATDTGDYLDPNDDGHLVLDRDFNLTDIRSQSWISDFCNNLKQQKFVDGKIVCLIEMVQNFQKSYCSRFKNKTGFCYDGNLSLPLKSEQLEKYLPLVSAYEIVHQNPSTVVYYDKNNIPAALFISTKIKDHFSTSYKKMNDIYTKLDSYLKKMMKTAPPGLKTAWFSGRGDFIFFDLQDAIAHGTYFSIILSLGVACVVMLFTSLNLLITLYAIITITFAIAVTVGCLVLMGWELNILESVTISLAVGLSIDFTIHYGVAYRLSKEKERVARVHESFVRVGPAVAMASLTTFVAGAVMMPCRVLAYLKLGVFLMLVMTFSWLYATFFFQSVCHALGPKGNFCQIPIPCMKKDDEEDDDLYPIDLDPENYDEVDELLLT